jgi:hypothetical protein
LFKAPIALSPTLCSTPPGQPGGVDRTLDLVRLTRDLNNIANMSANAIRLYNYNYNVDHTAFLDACLARGESALGGLSGRAAGMA